MCHDPVADHPRDGASTTWALSWQAAVGRDFLLNESLCIRIRQRLIDAHQRPGRVLIDYVLMPTEIHVIAEIALGDSAGGIARAFGNVISRWVREMQAIRSPVLAGPYRAQPLTSPDAVRSEIRMLSWRPVLLGLCSTPTHYAQGALRTALGRATAKGFNARPMLLNFGGPIPEARAALGRWIRRRPSETDWRAWELTRGLQLATGSVGPHQSMARAVDGPAAALIAAGGTYGIDGALTILETWVATRLGLPVAPGIRDAAGSEGARARALVACLAVTHRLCSAASVARHFGRAKATISEQTSACRERASDRAILAIPLDRILEESVLLRPSLDGAKRLPGVAP